MFSPSIYAPLFYNSVLIFVIIKYISISMSNDFDVKKNETLNAYFVCFVLILFLGTRPISGYYFGDTGTYANHYNKLEIGDISFMKSTEWLWYGLMKVCIDLKMSVQAWFTVIEFLYIGLLLWVCSRIMKEKIYIAILFFVSALFFYGGAVNGLRIGVASNILLLALTYIMEKNTKKKILAFVLCFFAFNLHHSIILPIVCMIISNYFFSNIKYSIIIWGISIILSAIAGNITLSIIENIGLFNFDERFSQYLNINDVDIMNQFRHTGFRWDFLLYSSAPIIFGWYLIIKKKIYDKQYIMILNTYILANAFWVLVIRSNFSNRFASLSWFIYPILFAYPLIKFKIWKRQNSKMALILLGNTFFSYVMWLIGR